MAILKDTQVNGTLAVTEDLNVSGDIIGDTFSGNSATATKFNSSRTIQLTGGVTGSASDDGLDGLSIITTVPGDSHTHVISNVDGLSDALNDKQATVTGGASTITSSNLTPSRALISDGDGKVAVSDVKSTELGWLAGVTSAIQTQLNDRATFTANTFTGKQTITITDAAQTTEALVVTTGQIKASTFNATSDARLKENFQPLTLEKSILDLPTYKFDFINGAKNQIGCKAQDLQEICPEIVNEGSDGYLSIQESKIVYLLLEEVKKLRDELSIYRAALTS